MLRIHIENILNRIKQAYTIKSDAELARFLDIKPSTLANWRKRGTINFNLVFTKCESISLDWLIFGRGNTFFTENNKKVGFKNLEPKSELLKSANEDKHLHEQILTLSRLLLQKTEECEKLRKYLNDIKMDL